MLREPAVSSVRHERWFDPVPEAYATGHTTGEGWRFADGECTPQLDALIEEVPVALIYGDAEPIVTMATPLDVEDLALGFAITERIVDVADQVQSVNAVPANGGLAVFVELAHGLDARVRSRSRAGIATGACGLCGMGDVDQVLRLPPPLAKSQQFRTAAILRAFAELPAHQSINQRTGSAHAAAFVDAHGRILAITEDAGRHNALDKLIGRLARLRLDPGQGFCAVTSRASYELALKAATARLPMLCAISAPTGLAVRLAAACELTLCAFVRHGRITCFAGPERLK